MRSAADYQARTNGTALCALLYYARWVGGWVGGGLIKRLESHATPTETILEANLHRSKLLSLKNMRRKLHQLYYRSD